MDTIKKQNRFFNYIKIYNFQKIWEYQFLTILIEVTAHQDA